MAAKKMMGVDIQDMAPDDEFAYVGLAQLDQNGHEVLDPAPMYPTVGFQDPPTLEQQIKMLLQQERVREALEAEGFETPEEADDFEVGDDFEPFSFHEFSEEEEEAARAFIAQRREEEARRRTTPPSPPAPAPTVEGAEPVAPPEGLGE